MSTILQKINAINYIFNVFYEHKLRPHSPVSFIYPFQNKWNDKTVICRIKETYYRPSHIMILLLSIMRALELEGGGKYGGKWVKY